MSDRLLKLWIDGPAGKLEARLRPHAEPRAAAVVAHPHPLYGGNLDNPPVFHSDRELHRAGFATLRLNFRGVGSSEGVFDDGRGEVEDLAVATRWLRALAPAAPWLLVGYSFGSICALRLARAEPSCAGVVAMGLPLSVYGAGELGASEAPLAVVQGESDEFGLPGEIDKALASIRAPHRLWTVAGANHIFAERARETAAAVVEAARWCLGARS